MAEDRSTTRGPRRREPLDRAAIVAAAVALADEEGVGALTMRRLAARLGFKAMALYNHVASKDEVVGLMVDAVAAEIDAAPAADSPLEAIRALAVATREAFVQHPWAAELWQQHMPGPARRDHMEQLLRLFSQSGLPADLAHHGFHAVNNHVLGYTLQELALDFDTTDPAAQAAIEEFLASTPADTYPHTVAHVHEHLDGNTASSFELVLDLILDGLTRLHATTR